MSIYNQLTLQSRQNHESIETAVGSSIFSLRERECQLFSEDRDSPTALRLALIRTELQWILSGQPVHLQALEHAVQPRAADSPKGSACDLATDLEAVEVVADG